MSKSTFKKMVVAIVMGVAICMTGVAGYDGGIGIVHAAELVTKMTTMECSVWSQPNTAEEYRVKRIPAGYNVTVYPEIVQSTAGDGKTFYQTGKGCYILCKCFGEAADEEPVGTIEVLAEYTLPNRWSTNRFIILRNNSLETLEVSTDSLAYAVDGQMIAVSGDDCHALGAGCVSIIWEYYQTNETVGYYETSLEVRKSRYYKSVIQDLSYVQTNIEDGVIFQVTNNGEYAAEFVRGYVLFFRDGRLVDYDWTYFTDDASEIKPGKTISKQFRSFENFDRVEFYLTGRR